MGEGMHDLNIIFSTLIKKVLTNNIMEAAVI